MGPDHRFPAPAKLNLFLHVTGRRASGYHDIQTLFQLLDWGDEVRIRLRDDGLVRRVRALPGVDEPDDLSIRAARELQAACNVRLGAAIEVLKRIPMGAGLGGGSSDAATVLHALNRLWDCRLSQDDLARLGAKLGADVPVFVRGRSAWAEGIGDRISPVELGERWYVLLTPGVPVDTAELFSAPELVRDTAVIEPGDFSFERTHNAFQDIALARHEGLRNMLSGLADTGDWRMTGTGSAFFLRAPDEKFARRTAHALKSLYNVRAVRGVDWSPLVFPADFGAS
ncbi:MAG: 4-(cytidine 5'-diphospho)-2-C-methyl-D-erythritol kinase [Xanthomonadales bacterium]|nr:4-(cytidine 5'-diphospho)-2-C-methyl-D-erythritol kinase [Xanthomonadales bacterium]